MDRGDLDEAGDACGGLDIAGGDAPKRRREAHHALDAVAPSVSSPVQRVRPRAVRCPRADRMRALRMQFRLQLIAAATFARQQLAWPLLSASGQRGGGGDVDRSSGCQMHRDRHTTRLGQHMDRGAEANARPARGARTAPPFMAPALVPVRSDDGAVDHLECGAPGDSDRQAFDEGFEPPGVAPVGDAAPHPRSTCRSAQARRATMSLWAIRTTPSRPRRVWVEGRQA